MSDLNLDNIVGFKAVDKDGNEQNVTVDEMVDMVSTRMVMALSETSTFAAVAATGNDVYENELPTVTDAANVRVLQSSGDAAQMTMQSLASKLEGLMPIANLGSEGLLRKGVLSPVLACNKGSVQEVCIVRIANSGNSYVGVILYIYWGGVTGMFFINSNTGNSYIIRKVNGSITSEIEFKRKDGSLFVRSKTNTASFRVSALFLDSSFVDLSSSMNIVDENLDDAENVEIL